jgi:hypothetical protein
MIVALIAETDSEGKKMSFARLEAVESPHHIDSGRVAPLSHRPDAVAYIGPHFRLGQKNLSRLIPHA